MAMEYSMAKIMVQRYEQMKMLQWNKRRAAYNLSAKFFDLYGWKVMSEEILSHILRYYYKS